MAMDVFELFAKIGLDTSEFDRGLDTAGSKLNSLSGRITAGVSGAVKGAVTAFAGATAAAGAFTAAAVQTGLSFDASMSNVSAISGATGDDFDKLKDKAMEMGATTKFSATEAADAMGYMAMAGWKTEQMLGGIDGIMSLAAASGEDLATTSDIVTDALTAFGLTADDAGHFADVLAAASSNANTNVTMMGESFKYVAPMAGALGYEAEDVAVALGLMANAGIKSSQAGTSLRSLFNRMAKQPKEAATAMNALGLSLEDGKGNMLSFREVMGDIRDAFRNDLKIPADELQTQMEELDAAFQSGQISETDYEKATEELSKRAFGAEGALKAQYAAMLAGTTGMSGLLAIINASDEDYQKLTESIDNCEGTAKRMADTMGDNLQGALTILKSSFEGLQLAISERVTPSITKFIKFGSGAFGEISEALRKDGFEGAFAVIEDIFTKRIPEKIKSHLAKIGADELFIVFDTVSGGFNRIVEGIKKAVDKLKEKFDEFKKSDKFTAFLERLREISETFSSERIAAILEGIGLGIGKVAEAIIDFINSDLVINFFKSLGEWIDKEGAEGIANKIKLIADALLAIVVANKVVGVIKGISGAFNMLKSAVDGVRGLSTAANTITSLAGSGAGTGGAAAAGQAAGQAAAGGFAAAFKALPSLMTMDVATLFGAGTGAEIGMALGTTVIGGIVAAFAGAELGKTIGAYLFPEDAELYAQYSGIDGTVRMLGDSFKALGDSIAMAGNEAEKAYDKMERAKELTGDSEQGQDWNSRLTHGLTKTAFDNADSNQQSMMIEQRIENFKVLQEMIRSSQESATNAIDLAQEQRDSLGVTIQQYNQLMDQAFNKWGEEALLAAEVSQSAIDKRYKAVDEGLNKTSESIKAQSEAIDEATEKTGELSEALDQTNASVVAQEDIDNLSTFNEKVGEVDSEMANAFDSEKFAMYGDAISQLMSEKFTGGLDSIAEAFGVWGEEIKNGWQTVLDDLVTRFEEWSVKLDGQIQTLKESIGNVCEDIKGSVQSLMDWLQENVKVPHISFEGDFDLENKTAPTVKVDWYAKAMDNAMVLNNATIFGASGGRLLGGGEAGSEVVSGAGTLMNMIRSAVSQNTAQNMTVIMELDKTELGRVVYKLNNEETRRVGVRLANV